MNSEYNLINEGQVKIYQPKNVFYNPVQEFNRDLSILVLDTYLENELWQNENKAKKLKNIKLKVLDALSASGLRGIRFAKELINGNKIDKFFLNDYSTKAFEMMQMNVKLNNLEDKINIENKDANLLMYLNSVNFNDKFICVDLDPYGCAGPFLDPLVQCVHDGGILMITATDLAILCGNFPETCFAKYGSTSIRNKAYHEMALRILLRAVDSAAIRHEKHIKPLLSISVDFYIRIFVQIFSSASEAKNGATKSSILYQCKGCYNYKLQNFCNTSNKTKNKFLITTGPPVNKLCDICDSTFHMAGPIWSSELHDSKFLQMLKVQLDKITNTYQKFGTQKRIKGLIYLISEELVNVPLFYSLKNFCSILKIQLPSAVKFRSAILNAGYDVSYSHTNPDSFKTNAPVEVLWDIIVKWYLIQKNKTLLKECVQEENLSIQQKIKSRILQREIKINVSFEKHIKEIPESMKKDLLRYQQNPTKFWGPMSKAYEKNEDNFNSKKSLNQNKKKRKLLENVL